MSKKKRGGRRRRHQPVVSDVLLSQAADAEKKVHRQPKLLKNNQKQLSDTLATAKEKIAEDCTTVVDTWEELADQDILSGKKKVQSIELKMKQGSYAVYPFEFWELIADHVHPESVATFSCICRDTYAIVNRAKFWRRLYFNHCKRQENLSARLQLENVIANHRLK